MCPLLLEVGVFLGLKQQRNLLIKKENTAFVGCSSTLSPLKTWVWKRLFWADFQAFACHGGQSLTTSTTRWSQTWADAADSALEMECHGIKKEGVWCLLRGVWGVNPLSGVDHCFISQWQGFVAIQQVTRRVLVDIPIDPSPEWGEFVHFSRSDQRGTRLWGVADPWILFLSLPKAGWLRTISWASTSVLQVMSYGGMGFCGRKGAE